jgi:hypothetical protein
LVFAARLTPILYEKLRGNPRRIKRFLNDLHVRQSIAAKRGIELDPEVIAKLMVLEVLLPDAFQSVLEWVARNELREKIAALEAAAGKGPTGVEPFATEQGAEEIDDQSKPHGKTGQKDSSAGGKVTALKDPDAESASPFTDEMIRWAKLPPELSDSDLGPYLFLAAAFTGKALLDEGLPIRLRDLASNLVSSVRAEQKSVRDDDLAALTPEDARSLAQHLGRVARDRPTEQVAAFVGMLRLAGLNSSSASVVAEALNSIPGSDIEPATALLFSEPSRKQAYSAVLQRWQGRAAGPTKTALTTILKGAS